MSTQIPGHTPFPCQYCQLGQRALCTCTEDCGARAGELTGHDCPQRPCACYSCGGGCGGTQQPGSCGRLEDVAGQPICAVCREAADVFALDDSDRLGMKATTDGHQVTIRTNVFGHFHLSNFSPKMARAFGLRLLELGWEAEMSEPSETVAALLLEVRAAIAFDDACNAALRDER